MKIFDLVKAMLPSIDRNNVLSDIRLLKEELEGQTIPPYQAAVDARTFASDKKFKNKWCLDFQKDFDLATRNLRVRGNYIEATLAILNTLPARLEWLRGQYENKTGETIVSNGLTFPVANLIQMHSAMAFAVRYARKVLLLSYAHETAEHFEQRNGKMPYTPAEIKDIEKQRDDYLRIMALLGRPDLQKIMESVPDVVVDGSDVSGTVSAYGQTRLTPANFALSYTQYPIYFIREWFAERQVAQYEAAKAEKLALELFLIQLKQSQTGSVDASVQKQIEYHTNRLQRLQMDIEKMEADLS